MRAGRGDLSGFFQKVGEFVEQVRVFAFERFADTTFEVVVEYLRPNPAQGTRDGICKPQDVDAGSVVCNHLLKCARLSLDATQARDELSLGFIRAAMRF